MRIKIKCPDGQEKSIEQCLTCGKCLPKAIKAALLANRYKERPKAQKPSFGITKLTNDCLRKSYYELTEEQILPLERLWVYARGQALHWFFQRGLKKEEREVFVKREFPTFSLLAFIDAIHEGILYELKSTANIPEYPQSHHTLQAQAYYSMLDEGRRARINKILLIYLSMQKIKTFEIPKRDILPWLEEKGKKLAAALKTKTLPKKQEGWLCNYCTFKELCQKE